MLLVIMTSSLEAGQYATIVRVVGIEMPVPNVQVGTQERMRIAATSKGFEPRRETW